MFSFLKLIFAMVAIAVAYAMTSKEELQKKPRIHMEKPIKIKTKRIRGPW